MDVGAARFVRAVRGFQISIYKVLVLLLAGVALLTFSVVYRGYMKGVTADAIRQIKQRLLIFEGENGGFPESFEVLGQRGIAIAPNERLDSWKNTIRYTVSEPYPKDRMSDFGGQLYGQAELRSAGPNGKFGDDDDLVWSGKAAR